MHLGGHTKEGVSPTSENGSTHYGAASYPDTKQSLSQRRGDLSSAQTPNDIERSQGGFDPQDHLSNSIQSSAQQLSSQKMKKLNAQKSLSIEYVDEHDEKDDLDASCGLDEISTPKKPGMSFAFVSVLPSKKNFVDKNLVKHFKQIQEHQLKEWQGQGLNIKFISRPGMSDPLSPSQTSANQGQSDQQNQSLGSSLSLPKKQKASHLVNNFLDEQKQFAKFEEKRFRSMLDLMLKFRDWEEDKIRLQLMQGGNMVIPAGQDEAQQESSNNSPLVPDMEQYAAQSPQHQIQNIQNNMKAEFINFKPLKDSSILMRDGQSTIYFQKGAILNQQMQNDSSSSSLFKLIKCEAKLLRAVLEVNNFQQTESHDWNLLWSSQSFKQYIYDNLNEYQKLNHFPNSFELTRKDRLCTNIVKMQEKFGKDKFDILPDTYNLPDEFADFYSHFHQLRQKQESKEGSNPSINHNQWIIKPTNSSQGKGIFIIDEISEVPIDEPCIVSRYITNPLLINGLKFDVRIYVLVTSMDPWRIYIFNEGLARFASEDYNSANIKSNKFAHLTNYSINKKSEKFVQNVNADQGDEGHKWSLAALSKHLEQMGVDNDLLWSKIYDVILKSLIAVDGSIQSQLKKLYTRNNCFELLGFDILIDQDLKPWLMEVNLSPSLACDSPIDLKIKHSLFLDTMNLICQKKFDRRRENLNKMKQRAKNVVRAKSYQSRQNANNPNNPNQKNASAGGNQNQMGSSQAHGSQSVQPGGLSLNNRATLEKLQSIPPKYRDALRETLQEQFRKGGFIRIYPSKNSNVYDQFFGGGGFQERSGQAGNHSKISNKILYKHLYSDFLGNQNESILRTFQRTISKHQQVGSNQSSQNSFAVEEQQTPDTDQKKSNKKFTKIQMGSMNGQLLSTQKPYLGKRGQAMTISGSNQTSQIEQSFQTKGKQALLPSLNQGSGAVASGQTKKEKLMITGDDILIEYVARLMSAIRSIAQNMLKAQWIYQIEKFIKHSVWHSSDVRRAQNNKLWQRLESRLIEMKERRKRLLQSMYKKELKLFQEAQGFSANRQKQQEELEQFQKENKFREEQKNVIIQGFSAQQLEDMLHTSTKNVAYEVISCLITVVPADSTSSSQPMSSNQKSLLNSQGGDSSQKVQCKGVLTDIIKWLTMTNQQATLKDVEFSMLDQISTKQNPTRRFNGNHASSAQKQRKDRKGYGTSNNQTAQGIRSGKLSNQIIEDDTESYQLVPGFNEFSGDQQQEGVPKDQSLSTKLSPQDLSSRKRNYIEVMGDSSQSPIKGGNSNRNPSIMGQSNSNFIKVDDSLTGSGQPFSVERSLGAIKMQKQISAAKSGMGRIIINDDLSTHHQLLQQERKNEFINQLNPNKLNLDAPTGQLALPKTNMRHHSDKIAVLNDPFQRPNTLIAPRIDNNQDLIHVSDSSANSKNKLGNTDNFSINKDLDNLDQGGDLSTTKKNIKVKKLSSQFVHNEDRKSIQSKELTIESSDNGNHKVSGVSYHPQSPFEGERRHSKNQAIQSGQSSIGKKTKKAAIILNKNMINFSGSRKDHLEKDKSKSNQHVDTVNTPNRNKSKV